MLLAPSASASSSVHGLCLFGCGVANLANVTNSSQTDFASMSVAVGVAASVSLRVSNSSGPFPAGRRTGFLVADPSALLNLTLLQNVTVETLLSGSVQESATVANLLELQALGLFNNPREGFVGFRTTKPFDAVQLDLGLEPVARAEVHAKGVLPIPPDVLERAAVARGGSVGVDDARMRIEPE